MTSPRIQPVNYEAEFQHTGTKPFGPPPITNIDDTGLSKLWLQDLAIKILYFRGT